jgi:nicotinic acid mononucleotide adenylyltransferase
LLNRKLVYFNGAFSPPTSAHAHIAASIFKDLAVDALWMDPEPCTPHKPQWLDGTLEARVEMCERLLGSFDLSASAGVGTLRRDLGPEVGNTVELFHTLRALLGGCGHGRLVWALGADVLDGMRFWAEKAREFLQPGVTCDGFLIFVRDGWTEKQLLAIAAVVLGREPAAEEISVIVMPEEVAAVSSHKARKAIVLAAAATPAEDLCLVPLAVREVCLNRPEVLEAYRDQVVHTPDATPILTAGEDPQFAADDFAIDA